MLFKPLMGLNDPAVAAATRGSRRQFFATLPLLADASPEAIDTLLAASTEVAGNGQRLLYEQGSTTPEHIFLVRRGTVLIRHRANYDGHNPGDGWLVECIEVGGLVMDDELFDLLAGGDGRDTIRRCSAVGLEAVTVVAVRPAGFRDFLKMVPAVRNHLVGLAKKRMAEAQARLDDYAALKNDSKILLAKLLLTLFSLAGKTDGVRTRLPRPISQNELGSALGLSRRQIAEDLPALRLLETVEEDQTGCLLLLEGERLERLTKRGTDEGDRWAWIQDIEKAVRMEALPRARAMAALALSYFPEDDDLHYLAALAALRSGSLKDAEKLLDRRPFSTSHPEEDKAALVARVDKERAFEAGSTAERRRLALRSATLYREIHAAASGTTYTGINAAAMLRVAGQAEASQQVAHTVLAALSTKPPGDYWEWATRAEALGLLGRFDEAKADLTRARRASDANPGSIGSTRRQFRRLAEVTGEPGWPELLRIIRLPDAVMIPGHPDSEDAQAIIGHLDAVQPGAAWLGSLATESDIAVAEHLAARGVPVAAVLPDSIPPNYRHMKGRVAIRTMRDQPSDHAAHTAEWQRQANRQALGLAIVEAGAQERFCYLVDGARAVQVSAPGGAVDHGLLPGWANPHEPTPGFRAAVTTDADALDLLPPGIPGILPLDRRGERPPLICDTLPTALALAFSLSEQAARAGRRQLTLCDFLHDGETGRQRDAIAVSLRATADNQLYASAAFIAELAILSPPGVTWFHAGKAGRKPAAVDLWTLHRNDDPAR
jgi:tetratricopeptide (TPR) repeat protein